MSVLSIKKLNTSEDDGLQEALAKLDRTEAFAQDIVLAGAAVPVNERDGARIDEALDELATMPVPETWADDDAVVPAYRERAEWAYMLGLAVGALMAKVNGGAR